MGTAILPKKCAECGSLFRPRSVYSSFAIYCCKECSKNAANRRAKEKIIEAQRDAIVSQIEEGQQYLSIREALALFEVSRPYLYLLIRRGEIPALKTGPHKTRVKKTDLEQIFVTRKDYKNAEPLPKRQPFYLEKEDCYTIGEIGERFRVGESTVYTNIRKYHIPTRQFGRFVYAPKKVVEKYFNTLP